MGVCSQLVYPTDSEQRERWTGAFRTAGIETVWSMRHQYAYLCSIWEDMEDLWKMLPITDCDNVLNGRAVFNCFSHE